MKFSPYPPDVLQSYGALLVFVVPRFFLLGPALYPVPCPGLCCLWGAMTVWGPAIANQFHTINAGFWHMYAQS